MSVGFVGVGGGGGELSVGLMRVKLVLSSPRSFG